MRMSGWSSCRAVKTRIVSNAPAAAARAGKQPRCLLYVSRAAPPRHVSQKRSAGTLSVSGRKRREVPRREERGGGEKEASEGEKCLGRREEGGKRRKERGSRRKDNARASRQFEPSIENGQGPCVAEQRAGVTAVTECERSQPIEHGQESLEQKLASLIVFASRSTPVYLVTKYLFVALCQRDVKWWVTWQCRRDASNIASFLTFIPQASVSRIAVIGVLLNSTTESSGPLARKRELENEHTNLVERESIKASWLRLGTADQLWAHHEGRARSTLILESGGQDLGFESTQQCMFYDSELSTRSNCT
eukprot:1798891-Rhodomonas_salina.1